MPLKNIPLTKEDFDLLSWESVLNQAQTKSCDDYYKLFFNRAREAEENGNEKVQEAYALLGAISSFFLKLDDVTDGPFHPLFSFESSRGYVPGDISDHHLDTLGEIVHSINDAEMRARIADVLWVTKHDYQLAQLAITSYQQAASELEGTQTWVQCLDRMERALDLAATLDRDGQLYEDVVNYFVTFIDRIVSSPVPYYVISRTMELLQQQRKGDFAKYAGQAHAAALSAENDSNWLSAERLWRVEARWHALNKDTDLERVALIAAAETNVKYTEEILNQDPPNYLVAQANLQQAIEGLRRVGGMQERISDLHKLLLEYQEKSSSNMEAFSISVDLKDLAKSVREEIKGKSLYESLLTLGRLDLIKNVTSLRTEVEDLIRDYPLRFAISGVTVTEKGKVTAKRPTVITSDLDEQELGIRAEMFHQAGLHQDLVAMGIVMPALNQINLEHNPRTLDLLPLLNNNLFVPPGRENIFAQGLAAGIQRDFVIATHLLVPQIENSIRYLLYRYGVITSKLTSTGIQDEYDLNRMLYMDEVKEIFGEDIVFDLQGLLVERHGTNLRNLMAHGLLSYTAFFSPRMIFLWWLALHLCILPIIMVDSD